MFKVLRSASKFVWGKEQSKAFHDLKEYLENMTKMTSSDPKDTILLYVSASPSAVSATLVVEIYYVSEALSTSKLFYSELEKIAYVVVMASRKLRHYFEGHRTIVVTSQPIHDLFRNREALARISNWATELSEFYIDFERRTAIKSQVLADFIADWTNPTF